MGISEMTGMSMCIALWIPSLQTNHFGICNECLFPLQQMLHKCTSLLHDVYIAWFLWT